VPWLRFSYFSFLSLCFSSSLNFLNPSILPPAWLFIGKGHLGQGKLGLANWLLSPEGNSSPRQASYLGLKEFHSPSELDASLGELGSRNFQKMVILPFSLWFLFLNPTIKHQFERSLDPALQPVPNTVI